MLFRLILSVAVAFFATAVFFACLRCLQEEEGTDEQRLVWKTFLFLSPPIAVVALGATYWHLQHLMAEWPETLRNFWLWYFFGFISRVPLLYYRGHIFHPVFDTEWEEVFRTFLNALLGPIQIIFTVWGIWEHWKNPWPWDKDE